MGLFLSFRFFPFLKKKKRTIEEENRKEENKQ